MASAPGIPDNIHETVDETAGRGEDEPLLGRVGDASQPEGRPLYSNLTLGELLAILHTAIILLTNW